MLSVVCLKTGDLDFYFILFGEIAHRNNRIILFYKSKGKLFAYLFTISQVGGWAELDDILRYFVPGYFAGGLFYRGYFDRVF